MEYLTRSSMAVLFGMLCVVGCVCTEIETPKYRVVRSESEFEIRLYAHSTWMSASIAPRLSFAKATRIGYHRLFQYIEGANLNSSRIPMTIPVLTSIVPGPGPGSGSPHPHPHPHPHPTADSVRFYLPEKFQADPPLPLPQLNLRPHRSAAGRCVAARKFSGFARDWNIGEEAEKLVVSLSREYPWAAAKKSSAYSVAQYSSPFKFTGRLNEVWVDIDGPGLKDCIPGGIASY